MRCARSQKRKRHIMHIDDIVRLKAQLEQQCARDATASLHAVKPHCGKSQLQLLQLQYRALAAALHYQPVTRNSN